MPLKQKQQDFLSCLCLLLLVMEGPAWHLTKQSTASPKPISIPEYSDTTDEETKAKRLLYWSLSSGELPSLEVRWASSVAGVGPVHEAEVDSCCVHWPWAPTLCCLLLLHTDSSSRIGMWPLGTVTGYMGRHGLFLSLWLLAV